MVPNRIKIILVEDDPADAVLIERQIKKIIAFPNLLHINTLQDLVDSAENFNPDIVLCDYQLQGFTGFEVLEHIKSLSRYIPIIFITGTINDEELAANTILTGATGYILKKNINTLHEKLLPHFTRIIEWKQEINLSSTQEKVIEEMQAYLSQVMENGKINRACYLELDRAFEKIKSLDR